MEDDSAVRRASLELYKEKFQTPFLDATKAHYKKESQAFLAENSISDYLKRVEVRLEEEARRVDLYLHSSTSKAVSTYVAQDKHEYASDDHPLHIVDEPMRRNTHYGSHDGYSRRIPENVGGRSKRG
jgi:hypothetical protein